MAVIKETLVLEDKFSVTLGKYTLLLGKANTASQRMIGAARQQASAGGQAAEAAQKAATAQIQHNQSLQQGQTAALGLTGRLKGLVGAYAGLQGVKALVGLSDTVTQTTARLDLINDGLQTTAELNDMVYASAQRARGSYTETANMVAKLGTLAGDAFGSSAEIVAFVEQLNKQMAISGTNTVEAQAAMLQLTQGLSSGVLRGEELNSVMEQTPMIAQTIADYLGVSTGEMRELASEGLVTADVVKNAMFAAAEETNKKFEEMPLTWRQVWTMLQNSVTKALAPVLTAINWLANNFDRLLPIVVGVTGAMAALLVVTKAQALWTAATTAGTVAYNVAMMAKAVIMGLVAAATGSATMAQQALNAAMLANPIGWVILLIGIIIALIYKWVQSVGGLQIAWLIVVDKVLYGWDTLKAGFFTGVYWVMDLFDKMKLKFLEVSVNIQNFMGDMKAGFLNILQNMVNQGIDIINWFIDKLNKLPGVSIDAIEQVTFGATAAAENEAAKSQRNAELAAARQETNDRMAERAAKLDAMWAERDANSAARKAEISQKQAEKAAESQAQGGAEYVSGGGTTSALEGISSQLGGISDDVGSIEKSVSLAEEDIADMVDMATRRYVNKINLTAQTPVITINGANTGNTAADRKALADTIRDVILEQAAAASYRSTARVY